MPPSLAADGEAPRSSPMPITDTALPLLALHRDPRPP